MGGPAVLRAYARLARSQRFPPDRLRALRDARLREVVRAAAAHVPFWRRRLRAAGIDPRAVQGTDDLEALPIVTRDELRAADPVDLLDERSDRDLLATFLSSGSTGCPFAVAYDPGFRAVRDALFLRALRTAGWRPGRRLLLLTGDGAGPRAAAALGWTYASIRAPATAHRALARRARPHVLYGCTTTLGLLADELVAAGERWPQLRAVVTTAESLDAGTRRRLEAAYGCRVLDVYGTTETGLVGWECGAGTGYHLAETIRAEAVPVPGEDAARLVLTSLVVRAMPFLRYDSGDLGALADDRPCPCGRTLPRLARVDGRRVDCVVLPDGRRLSPYRLTCAVETLGLRRYQVVQSACGAVTVRVEAPEGPDTVPVERIRAALAGVLGADAVVSVDGVPRLLPEPGRKFRVVESRVGAEETS